MNNSTEKIYDDRIYLSSIFAILWKRRKLIIIGTLGATFLSIGISLMLPKVYRSEGFFQLGNPVKTNSEIEKISIKKIAAAAGSVKKATSIGIPVPLYKKSSSQFFNPNRFQLIANQHKSFNAEELGKLKHNFKAPIDIIKWVKPVYAFAKEDVREFAQLPQDEANSVIGINLSYEANSPEEAYAYVSFFGDYIRDCLLYVTLFNYIIDGYSSTLTQINKIDNDIIGIQFELLQNTNKLKDIQAILSNYPDSARIENRQLVSIQEGGERFLAPVTQLVGIESTLADLRRNLAELEREKEKSTSRAEYFSRCHSELSKIRENGEALFLLLKFAKDEVFKNKDLNYDAYKEVFNSLNIDLQMFEFIFYSNTRFISGPTVPDIPVKPYKSIIVIVSFLGSFMLIIIIVLIFHGWQNFKKAAQIDPIL